MAPILIDTNILVYLVDAQDRLRQSRARAVIEALWQRQIGRLSVQNLGEFFRVSTTRLRPTLSPDEALLQIDRFQRMWPIFSLTPVIVLEAARGVRDHQLAYFDAQLWATARLNSVPLILSEDFQTGRILEGVTFANPFAADFQLSDWL